MQATLHGPAMTPHRSADSVQHERTGTPVPQSQRVGTILFSGIWGCRRRDGLTALKVPRGVMEDLDQTHNSTLHSAPTTARGQKVAPFEPAPASDAGTQKNPNAACSQLR